VLAAKYFVSCNGIFLMNFYLKYSLTFLLHTFGHSGRIGGAGVVA
jgi:hypothetical protein